MNHQDPIHFEELFDIDELQQLQDQIAYAFGVASIITHPDGTPITRPSNFTRLCQNIIRCSEKGKLNCMHSDAMIGRHNSGGPVIQPCLSGGLWDAGASITVGNQHVANWLIGQVRNEAQDEDRMREYAREIGAVEADFMQAFSEIPSMSIERFQKIAQVLFTMARQLSEKAYHDLQQTKIIAEKQVAEKALLESEERYRTTLYSIGDGVITTDSEGKVKMMNPIAEQLTGWTQQEATGKDLEDVFRIINEDTRLQVEIPVRKVLREGIVVGLANHTLLIARDGTERPIADSGAPIRNENGEIVGVVLVFSDQSEAQLRRKLLELRLKLFEYAVNHNLQETLTQILDEIGKFTNSPICFLHFMPEHKQSLGLQTCMSTTTKRDFCQADKSGLYCNSCGYECWNDNIRIIKPLVQNDFKSTPGKGGMPFEHSDITRELVVPVSRNEQVVAIIGIGNKLTEYTDIDVETVSFLADITVEIAENKIREENLQRSEERFHQLFEKAPLGYQSLNEDGCFTEINQAWCDTLGYQREEVVGKWFGDFLAPEYVDKFRERFPLFKKLGKVHSEFEMVHKNGERRFIAFDGRIGYKNDGSFGKTHCILQDITETRKMEVELRKSEEKYRRIAENITDVVWTSDLEMKTTYLSLSIERMLGEPVEVLISRTMEEKYPPESLNKIISILNEELEKENDPSCEKNRNRIFEVEHYHVNGSTVWLSMNVSFIRDEQGNPIGLQGSTRDITEKKLAEKREKEHAQNLSNILESISDAFVSLDTNWCYTYMNKKAGEIFGRNPQEMIGKHIWTEFPEGVGQVFYQTYYKAAETKELQFLEEYYPPYDLWFENLIYPSEKGLSIFFHDITERKRAQQKLREQERQLSSMVGNLPGFIYRCEYDENWTMLYVSEGCKSVTGYLPEDFMGNKSISFNEIIKEEYRELLFAQWDQVIANKTSFYQEYEIITMSGEIRWVLEQAVVVYDDDYKVKFLEGYIEDISERKKAELALRESEETIRLLFNSTAEGIYGIDVNGECIFCNKAALNMLGYSDDAEVLGKNMHNLIHHSHYDGSSIQSDECRVMQAFKDGTGTHCEDEAFWKKSGDSFPVEYWSYPIVRGDRLEGAVVTFIDITQKQLLSEELAKSESKYRYLFENNPAPMWIYDLETLSFLEVNEAAINHYGYTREEFLNMTIKDIRLGEDLHKLVRHLHTPTEMISHAGTWRHKKKDGEIIYVDIVLHQIEYESRQARLIISTDITERVNTQLEIEEERQLLRTLINNLPIAVYIKDREGKKVVTNQTDWERFGFQDESQIIGKTAQELYKGELGHRYFMDDMQIIQTGQSIINREEVFPGCTNTKRFFLSSKIPLYGRNREIIGILGVDREITESKKANEQILKLSRSVEQSPTIVVITDKAGTVEYVNSKFCEVSGYTKEEAIGQTPRILKSGMMSEELYKTLWETISLGEIWSGELYNRKKNGELFWEWTIITPLRNEHGEITNYIATKEDITNRKLMEEDLIVAKRKAEASDRLKSAFLANMSHEIRTPLNSIIGFSELLNDPDFDEEQKKEFIQHITFNGNNLLNVISDIVDISKMEAGEITIRKAKVNVCEIMEKMKKQHLIQKVEKPIEFRWVCPADNSENLNIVADKERLHQVFTNLLSNAMKFTSDGYIEVGCKPVNGFIEFYVMDTGIGISSDYHEQIFVRFRQVEASYTRKYGGNGLGLAITKNLIELMGGNIWVESEEGKGSTFYFTIPISTN